MSKRIRNFEIKFYRGITQRSPNYIEALIPLAEAYTREGLYEEGLAIDKRLSKLCKDDPTIHYNLACSYALVGHPDKAIKSLEKAVTLGYKDFRHMRRDEDLKSLHELKAFRKLFESKKS